MAYKLDLPEFLHWCEGELNGQFDAVPSYRRVHGQMVAQNRPDEWIPFVFREQELNEKLASRLVDSPAAVLEQVLHEANDDGHIYMQAPPAVQDLAVKRHQTNAAFRVRTSEIRGILDAVRNIVHEWSLKLEKSGIVGTGLSFSPVEKDKAATIHYNIGKVTGVVGPVTSSQVSIQSADGAAILENLTRTGLGPAEIEELRKIFQQLPRSQGSKKDSVLAQGFRWLMEYGPKIGAMADTVRGFLTGT
ncbi:MAG: hypothetical protein EYC70_00230 [Planctomycetota bacterium]|nr:MAG: hypothetical protein EYC70_00230 [Planctomycetota bacterium]